MSKYTTLETSRKLYEAFPEWGDLDDWYSEYVSYGDLQIVAPKYNTDYLLDKLQEWFSGMGGSDFGRIEVRLLGDAYVVSCRSWDDDMNVSFSYKSPAEALALLALKLKKEGIL